MDSLAWIWLIILVAFIVLEAVTAQLVAVWFIAGSAVGFASSLFGAPLWLQITLAVVVSIVTLIIVRPIVKKRLTPKTVATNADMSIGKTAVVTEKIDNEQGRGRVFLDGLTWTARSADGSLIAKGDKVTVFSIDGVKLIVNKYKEK